jgi:hypothetical protein
VQGKNLTNVGYEGPELKGARNVVIPLLDHREVAFHPLAFQAMYEFITGKPPVTAEIVPEDKPVLNGMVSGFANGAPTNLPLTGITVSVYEVDPGSGKRLGEAAHRKTTGADGWWGPFQAKPTAYYEFVFGGGNYPTFHICRTPFPRSSNHVGLRLRPAANEHESGAGSVVILSRPRGYLGLARDAFLIDGQPPEGVIAGVPTSDSGRMKFPPGPPRSVPVRLNKESLTLQTWPSGEGHVVIAEFHY